MTVPPRARPLLAALLALSALVALPACGQEERKTQADMEGAYVDVGSLQYQVQLSRQLNPRDTEDQAYFAGVANSEGLANNETWFAVFIKVWNTSEQRRTPASRFEIEDTTGKRYEPVAVTGTNPFAYRAVSIPADGTYPEADTVANEGAIGGSMLLFRITLDSLANRPLELRIITPQGHASVDLDV